MIRSKLKRVKLISSDKTHKFIIRRYYKKSTRDKEYYIVILYIGATKGIALSFKKSTKGHGIL